VCEISETLKMFRAKGPGAVLRNTNLPPFELKLTETAEHNTTIITLF